jgi:hypothetical protein
MLTAVLPATWIVLLASLMIRTHDSNWRPLYPMAKLSPYTIHFTATQVCFLAAPLLVIASLVQIIWLYRRQAEVSATRAAIALACSLGLSVLVVALNPAGWFTWFFD